MEFAKISTKYLCPIDLHFDNMYVSIMDKDGKFYLQKQIPVKEESLERILKPYLPDITIACESVPNHYRLTDFCNKHSVPFLLGHCQYMWKLYTKKKKGDRIDTEAMGDMMRTNSFPQAYAYPEGMRELRDLLRERMRIVRLRGGCYSRLQCVCAQYGVEDIGHIEVRRKGTRHGIVKKFENINVALKVAINLEQIERYDHDIKELEKQVAKTYTGELKKEIDVMESMPGTGRILSMTVIYEIHQIARFASPQKFSSYSRVIKCRRESNGKVTDKKNQKIGNPYLKWAFSLMAVQAIKHSEKIKKMHQRLKNKYGKTKALSILRHKIALATYMMLNNECPFNEELFVRTGRIR